MKFLSSIWFCQNKTMPEGVYFPRMFKYFAVYNAILRRHPKLKKVFLRRTYWLSDGLDRERAYGSDTLTAKSKRYCWSVYS